MNAKKAADKKRQHRKKPSERKQTAKDVTAEVYGSTCQQPDMDHDSFEIAKSKHYEKLKENQTNRDKMERSTVDQADCTEWWQKKEDYLFRFTVRKRLSHAGDYFLR